MNACSTDDLIAEIEGFDAEKATNAEKLQLAKAALGLAVNLAYEVAEDTRDEHAKAYFADQLAILASSDHGFLSGDFNIDKWIDQLARAEEKEDEG